MPSKKQIFTELLTFIRETILQGQNTILKYTNAQYTISLLLTENHNATQLHTGNRGGLTTALP
jgi:hypothetical protein